ncbi:MAG: hypothetical protein JKY71_09700 [Alphaproteobacteria bacterium]|nr:hypothetical protein [Alphaproteobacteria bacterium]
MKHRMFIVVMTVSLIVPACVQAMDAMFSGPTHTILDCIDPLGLINCLEDGIPTRPKPTINYTGPRYTSQINAYKRRGYSTTLELKKPPRTIRDKRVK